MKIFYRILAEVTGVVHGLVFISGLMVGFLWQELFWYYTLVFFLGFPSWMILRRCFMTDLENWLRIKSGQDTSHTKESFLGYWGVKALGKYSPSNSIITYIILGFYVFITPIWLYLLCSHYLTIY